MVHRPTYLGGDPVPTHGRRQNCVLPSLLVDILPFLHQRTTLQPPWVFSNFGLHFSRSQLAGDCQGFPVVPHERKQQGGLSGDSTYIVIKARRKSLMINLFSINSWSNTIVMMALLPSPTLSIGKHVYKIWMYDASILSLVLSFFQEQRRIGRPLELHGAGGDAVFERYPLFEPVSWRNSQCCRWRRSRGQYWNLGLWCKFNKDRHLDTWFYHNLFLKVQLTISYPRRAPWTQTLRMTCQLELEEYNRTNSVIQFSEPCASTDLLPNWLIDSVKLKKPTSTNINNKIIPFIVTAQFINPKVDDYTSYENKRKLFKLQNWAVKHIVKLWNQSVWNKLILLTIQRRIVCSCN